MQAPSIWFAVRPPEGLLFGFLSGTFSVHAKAAHSIYFEVLGDHGFVGLLLFLCLLGNALRTAWQVRKMTARRPALLWARDMADALGLAVFGFAVGGAGVSLAYFEMFYVVAFLLEALRQCVRKELAQPVSIAPEPRDAQVGNALGVGPQVPPISR